MKEKRKNMIREFTISIDEHQTTNDYRKVLYYCGEFATEVNFIEEYLLRFIKNNSAFKARYKDIDKKDKTLIIRIHIDADKDYCKRIDSSRAILCSLTSSYKDITPLRGTERTKKILDLFIEASIEIEKYIPGFKGVIAEAIQSFTDDDYKNIWTARKKRVAGFGYIKLMYDLTLSDMTISLVSENKEGKQSRLEIFKSSPRPIFYGGKFNKLLVEDGIISITDYIYEKPFFVISIDDLIAGKKGVFVQEYVEKMFKELRENAKNSDLLNCLVKNADNHISCPKLPKNYKEL